MDSYLEECRPLSLNARMGIAALVFEKFCQEKNIHATWVSESLDYLWEWPLIDGPDQFESWEAARPMLVDYGLSGNASEPLKDSLMEANVSEAMFSRIVCSLIEILWGSFWGAAEDEASYQCFRTVLTTCNVSELPPLTPFRFSLFSEGSGWGLRLTKKDRDFWRRCSGAQFTL